ncbi:MAG: copper amine oxidase N-terminal domain-containing protein, partial [Candidatus Eremiobacteraeota bacterium]|nr:copper amine oxidase N-terminal domain-containing protein [Candidatus Eremiobacteraeota bacterium]
MLAVSFALSFGITMVAASAASTTTVVQAPPAPATTAAPDFGAPPSGEVPLLFNDHHVYSKPDRLKKNRVLTAIVRGNTILVPMRSLFEQMGAAVTYDSNTKTVDVGKQGADVKVTVGKPEVTINGESRPLDVPAQMYMGTIVVPLRVLSEGMGAYVQWIPEKRLVVVRYVAVVPTAPPAPVPPPATPAPVATAKPTPSPTPVEVKRRDEHFIVGDYLFSPKVYNALSPGNSGTSSYNVTAAVEFPLFKLPWMLEGDFRSYRYPH